MLLQCLTSCLAQDYRPLDVDISDDSPSGDTEALLKSIPVPEGIVLRFRRNQPSLGESQNVNSLFLEARGRHVVLIHDDDVLLPGAITTLRRALSEYPQARAAFGIQDLITESGELDAEESNTLSSYYRRTPDYAGFLSDPLLCALRRQFPSNGYMVEAAAAREVQYRDYAAIGRAVDTDFAIRLAQRFSQCGFVFVPKRTSQYRITSGSSRTMTGISWKLYEMISRMNGLTPAQDDARDELMQRLVHHAIIDNAVNGQRMRSLQLMSSKPYRASASAKYIVYHLLVIAFPRLQRMSKAYFR